MKLWVEIGASLGYFISSIELWKFWKNRNRIQVHSVEHTLDQIILVLENLSTDKNSISPDVTIKGIFPINNTKYRGDFKIPPLINCELPGLERKSINIPVDDIANFFAVWYSTIIIRPTRGRALKIRYRNIQHSLSPARFYYELLQYKLFGKVNND